MNSPATVREALLVEAIGDVAKLLDRIEAVAPVVDKSSEALQGASESLREELADVERRMAALTEHAKSAVARHIATRADEAARRSIEHQSRAMADAARVAFGAEVGAMVKQLQACVQQLVRQQQPRWEPWLTYGAAVLVSATATWGLAIYVLPR
jgi:septal ring factor EnvC (AmiA/AmiB activator)